VGSFAENDLRMTDEDKASYASFSNEMCCSVLRCVALCCSCCSVLQCAAGILCIILKRHLGTSCTKWRRFIECLKLHVSFCKEATDDRGSCAGKDAASYAQAETASAAFRTRAP